MERQHFQHRNMYVEKLVQTLEGVDCFTPFADLNTDSNQILLELTEQEFTQMFSALMVGADVAYPDISHQIVINFLRGLHCPPAFGSETDDCYNYPMYAPFIDLFPANPYNDPDEIPSGYLAPPFSLAVGSPYEDTDLIVPFDSFPLLANWFDIIFGFLPQITINTIGDGQIEIDLLNTFNGGFAIVKVGSPPNILDIIGGIIDPNIWIIDLQIDIALPSEADLVVAQEVDIEVGAGIAEQTYITFIPAFDDAFPPFGLPLRYGGGIRQVGLCGFESGGVIVGMTDLRVVNCKIEAFENDEWVEKGDLSACIQPIADDLAEHELVFADTVAGLADDFLSNEVRLNDIEDNGAPISIYPDYPDFETEPEGLCGAAWKVAEELEQLCQDALTNAETITLWEWLDGLMIGGGWQSSILVQLWNLAVANLDPDLDDDLNAAIPEIAEIFYCNELSIGSAITDIQNHATLSVDVKLFFEEAINSVAAINWDEWVFIGSQDDTRDCSSFACGTWCYEFDFTSNDGGFNAVDYGPDFDALAGFYDTGQGWRSHGLVHIPSGGETFAIHAERNFSESVLTQIEVTYDYEIGHWWTGTQASFVNLDLSGGNVDTVNSANPDPDGTSKTLVWNGSQAANHLTFRTTPAYHNPQGEESEGVGLITKIKVSGNGLNPFGESNC